MRPIVRPIARAVAGVLGSVGGGGGGGGDPNFASVTSLLPLNGTNGSTTFTDIKGKTWTANGTAQISTAQSKFGGASALFNGGASDYIDTAASADFVVGTGDFTVECWYYPIAASGSFPRIFEVSTSGVFEAGTWLLMDRGLGAGYGLSVFNINNAGALIISSSINVVNGAWVHLALCRSGSTIRLFVDGVLRGSATNSTSFNSSNAKLFIGGNNEGADATCNAYIDDFRFTKGVARYTADFTPPTAAFPTS